jgi:hypothetical protein
MSKGLAFWLIFLICVIFGVYLGWPEQGAGYISFRPLGMNLVQFLLIGLLGWSVNGPPIKG